MKNKSKTNGKRLPPMAKGPRMQAVPSKLRRDMSRLMGTFGPVSTINTAPVAIGNSLAGSKPKVLQTAGGARVLGRDFAFAASSTVAAINDWELIGGMPLTPCVLVSSVLRNFSQIYNKFKITKMSVHYVTSSSTSQPGDVLFYYEKNRNSPAPDYSNSAFLNYIMSDPHTVIGPQWTNHSMTIEPVPEWKTTSFGVTADTDDDNQGTVYFFSKTNTTNSPGYILIDYDITFKELSINPRAGAFPVTRGLFNQICLSFTGAVTTAGLITNLVLTSGNTLDGNLSKLPPGALNGDIYKAVLNVAGSTKTGVNPIWAGTVTPSTTNLLLNADDLDTAVTIDDGFTCYLRMFDNTKDGTNTTLGALYPTVNNAVTNTRTFHWGLSATITSLNLVATISLITSGNTRFLQTQY